ncbi:hypothetical protein [Alteromonas sp. H39]|uniref:hypothetical protein n=1 Tax=Alteromonas sp. H39 TaxID=3389876 RepID=UPI0039DF8625
MIRISINGEEKNVDEIHENWIHNTVRELHAQGTSVCVIIRIIEGDVNLALPVGDCKTSPGRAPEPNSHTRDVLAYWQRMKVSELPINTGKIVAFLKQMKKL